MNYSMIMENVLDHLVKSRPMTDVVYRPYLCQTGVRQKAVLGGIEIDFVQRYGQAQPGKKVFIKTFLESINREPAFLNLAGSYDGIWLDGVALVPETVDKRGHCYRIRVSPHRQELVIARGLDNITDSLVITLSTVYYRCMDAKDYLTHMKMISPYGDGCMEGIGISQPVANHIDYQGILWNQPWELTNCIDFGAKYGNQAGKYAYALSQSTLSGTICLQAMCDCTVFSGETEVQIGAGEQKEIHLCSGDYLLIKAQRSLDWRFTYEDPQMILKMPKAAVTQNFGKFLVLGCFDTTGPEYGISFTKPYFNASTEQCFWELPVDGLTLRPYVDSCFYGQWFYALMVGNYGLLKSGEFLGRRDLTQYFTQGMKVLARFYDYALFEAKRYGEPTFLQRAVTLDNLDSIGAMGLCLAECYQRTGDGEVLSVLLRMMQAAKDNIPRFPDGTYHREDTMWADDIFMSLPFLMRMWEITGEEWCLMECFDQIRGFQKRLFMEDQKIFSHIFFLDTGVANRVPWGRGNGWIFLTMSDLLKKIRQHKLGFCYPDKVQEFVDTYCAFAAGLAACQDEEGMLHQVLNDRTSYQETSCTGMFATGVVYGVTCGVLPEEYISKAEKAMEGLNKMSITEEGVILGVCRGSSCSMNPEYYKKLGTVDDDDHGTGILLLAMTALEEWRQNHV